MDPAQVENIARGTELPVDAMLQSLGMAAYVPSGPVEEAPAGRAIAPQGAPEAAPGIAGPPEPVEAVTGAPGADTAAGLPEPSPFLDYVALGEQIRAAAPDDADAQMELLRPYLAGMEANRAEQVLIDTGITPPSAELPATPFDPSSVREDVRAFRVDPSEYEEPAQPAPPAPVEPELAPMEPIDLETQVPGMEPLEPVDRGCPRRARHWWMPMPRRCWSTLTRSRSPWMRTQSP